MEVGFGEQNLHNYNIQYFTSKKSEKSSIFRQKNVPENAVAKVINYSICQRTFFSLLFFGCKYINRSGLAQEKYSCCFPKVS